jgi:hypothetical protein
MFGVAGGDGLPMMYGGDGWMWGGLGGGGEADRSCGHRARPASWFVPQLTVAALPPEVMLARPRQKIERQIVAARRTTMRADPGLDTLVRAFRWAADARLRGKTPSPRIGRACGSYQAVAPPSTG